MGANSKLFWILSGFFVLADIVYVIWSVTYAAQYLATSPSLVPGAPIEWVGTVGLGLCAVLSALIAFYVGRLHAAQGGELPEDILDADIDDGEPEQGFFSPHSWWPVMLAGSLTLVFLGLAVGVWVSFFGAPLVAISIVGLVFQYYRREFAR